MCYNTELIPLPFRSDRELQPSPAGQLHFGPQEKSFRRFQIFDPPEVHRVVDPQSQLTSSAARRPDAQQQAIDSAPQTPHPVPVKPTGSAPDRADGLPQSSRILPCAKRVGGRVSRAWPYLVQFDRQFVGGRVCVGPSSMYSVLFLAGHRPDERFAVANRLKRHKRFNCIVITDSVVL